MSNNNVDELDEILEEAAQGIEHAKCDDSCKEREFYGDAKAKLQALIEREVEKERNKCVAIANWWIANDGRPKQLINDLEETDKPTLAQLKESSE